MIRATGAAAAVSLPTGRRRRSGLRQRSSRVVGVRAGPPSCRRRPVQSLTLFLGGVACRTAVLSLASVERFAASVALEVHLEDGGVMDEAVYGGYGGGFVGEHAVPFP